MFTENDVGETIPPMTPHAVSVSLPTWRSNVGYEEGEDWVLSKMKTGYPRFFIHKTIQKLADEIAKKYSQPNAGEKAILFPSTNTASRCADFIHKQAPQLKPAQVRIVNLVHSEYDEQLQDKIVIKLSVVLLPVDHFRHAKTFWQHSGEGISSRRAEYCHGLFVQGKLTDEKTSTSPQSRLSRGPRRYQRKTSIDQTSTAPAVLPVDSAPGQSDEIEDHDTTDYVEERFGRNLDISLAASAKLAIKRRIGGSLTANVGLKEALNLDTDKNRTREIEGGLSEEDINLYPTGMSAIYNTHRCLLAARGPMKSISFGFPYIDTLKVLEKFGPGCDFFGFGSSEELDELEKRLENGERYLGLFCEFPGNPLLKSPDLRRIRALADKYDFAVVVDETIGNFLNVHVLPYADVVVSSLTKVFSGDSNVMGGSLILNPAGKYHQLLKQTWNQEYEDNYWPEDAIFLERNSRDFVQRIERINVNAEAISELLLADRKIKQVNYPKCSPTREFYEHCRNKDGGYGGLLSATFFSTADAIAFYDNLDTAKGPSLGTNFTLSSPFVILAHYTELDWAASYGVEANLIRFSVGLEDTKELIATFQKALDAIPRGGATKE